MGIFSLVELQPCEIYSWHLTGHDGVSFFFDVKNGEDGLRLVVTRSYPSGRRDRITVPQADVGAFVRELLEAVSAMAGTSEPTPQHPPSRMEAIKSFHSNAYSAWIPEEDAKLLIERAKGHGIAHLAREHKRQPSAIKSRLKKLGDPGSQLPAVRPPLRVNSLPNEREKAT